MLRRRRVKVLLFLRVNFNEHIQLSVSPLCCCLQIINSEWRRADLISGSSRLFVSCFGFCCSPCPAFSMKVGFWNCGSRANWCTGSSRCTGQLISHFCWLLCNYTIGLPEDSKQKKKNLSCVFATSEATRRAKSSWLVVEQNSSGSISG